MTQEKEFHEEIQNLRNKFSKYLKENKLSEFNSYGIGINNKFVDLLILNELVHGKKEK